MHTRPDVSHEHSPRTTAASDSTAGRVGTATTATVESAGSIADPAPLGLAAFALTTFLLSLVNAKLIPAGTEPVVLGLALAYGGLSQLLAGMWEFRRGNTFGATAFGSFGAFWLSFWAYAVFYVHSIPTADADTATGWFLLSWGIFTTLMFLASLRTTVGLVALFALLAATFYVLGAGSLSGSSGVTTFGGYLGIVTAAVAWYCCLAGVMSSTFGRPVLPNPPLR
jgi:succinate-acetate transporter protein